MIHRIHRIRRVALLAAGLAALSLPGRAEAPTGNVHGAVEGPLVETLSATLAQIQSLHETVEIYDLQDQEISGPFLEVLLAALQQANADLEAAGIALSDDVPLEHGTDASQALRLLQTGLSWGESAIHELDHQNNSGVVSVSMEGLIEGLDAALRALMGTPITKKEGPVAALNPPPPTVAYDADPKSVRGTATVTKSDVATGRGSALRAIAKAIKLKIPTYHYARGASKTPAPPANYYYGFQGTSTDAGEIRKEFARPLSGPFELKFQVGSFVLDGPSDSGTAYVEFALEGSDPAQFLRVGGRRLGGGVQVVAQSHLGAVGTLLFPGARVATVRVLYDGTQFTCAAAEGIGAPDFVLENFGTLGLPQGETPFQAVIGATDLTKGALVALDEIYITPQ